jgi:hypothetical protein
VTVGLARLKSCPQGRLDYRRYSLYGPVTTDGTRCPGDRGRGIELMRGLMDDTKLD